MSRRRTGPTRAERRAALEQLLLALLRTPKTRAGLIAAAKAQDEGATANFVYGWISDTTRTGVVTMLKSMNPVQYQVTASILVEKPARSEWPEWLEPRRLPVADRRRVYLDGSAVNT